MRRLTYDLTGQRFGRLAVIRYLQGCGWLCRCDCGTEKAVLSGSLRRGGATSCGCFRREKMRSERTRHGHATTPTYLAWSHMKSRCENRNNKDYADYGGRGIRVCDRWQDFANFLADMGEKPSASHSIDRYPDNDGNYEPGNCRWATVLQQANNKRNNRILEFNGRRQTVPEWARELGFAASAIHGRLAKGWSVEDTLSRPRYGMIAFQGRTQSIHDWAKEAGISSATIYQRLDRGWPIERVLGASKQVMPKILAFRGRKQPLTAWAKELGIRPAIIHSRLYRGWPTEKALLTPVRR